MAHVLAKDLRDSVIKYGLLGKLTCQNKDESVQELVNKGEEFVKSSNAKNKIKKIDYTDISDEIPENWQWIQLGKVASIIRGLTFSTSFKEEKENTSLVLRGGNIDSKTELVNFIDNIYVDTSIIKKDQFIKKNDILIVASSGTKSSIGKSTLVLDDYTNVSFGGFMMVVRPNGLLNPKLLSWHIKRYRQKIIANTAGYISNITVPILANLLIPLPPIEEQARIVAKVDEIMAKINEYEKIENQLIKLKEQFPQDMKDSLLQAGMMGKLTEQLESDTIVDETSSFNTLNEERFDIPKAWTWFNLKDLMSICTGKKDQNFATSDGAYNFYTCAKEVFKAPNYSFEGESLILPGNGANVGTVTLYNGKFEAYQRTYVLQSINKTINMKFMYYCLLENWNQYNKNKMFGSAIPYIKLGNLQNYPVALPPIEEQQRIVDKLDELLPLVDKLAELN